MLDAILLLAGLVGLIVGSVTDLQRREVPDYVNYGLVVAAGGIRLVYAVLSGDWWQLLFSIIGAFLCFGVACLFFYSGQWGGGDAKMLIALGALFATYHSPIALIHPAYAVPAVLFGILPWYILQPILDYNLMFLVYLIVNILIAGAVYGVCWSITLAIRHRAVWLLAVKASLRTKKMKWLSTITSICIIGLLILAMTMHEPFLSWLLVGLAVIALIGFGLQLLVGAVEKACMIRTMPVSQLTEGEWIQHKVVIKGKYICGPKDLGVSEAQIELLKKYRVRNVIVKIGVPFIPAFLIGFIITVIWGNIFPFFLV